MRLGLGLGLGLTLSKGGGGRAPYLGNVATRGRLPGKFSAGNTKIMSRKGFYCRDNVTSFKVRFVNAYVTGGVETNMPGTPTLTMAIEYPSGTMTQVKWSGVASVSPASGATVDSDSINLTIAKGQQAWVRLFYSNASGIPYDSSNDDVGMGDQAALNGTDKTMSGTMTSAPQGFILGHCQILATTKVASVGLIGDSRMLGLQDTYTGSSGDRGELARSLGPTLPYFDLSCIGEMGSSFLTSHAIRLALLANCSHVVSNYGINDWSNGHAAATILADQDSIATLVTGIGKKFYDCTLPPETTSTDNWTTVVNQTVSVSPADSIRVTVNTALGLVRANRTANFDITSAVESALNSGKWKATGSAFGYSADGTHESPGGGAAIVTAAVVNPALFV
jgi:hypothetical protein